MITMHLAARRELRRYAKRRPRPDLDAARGILLSVWLGGIIWAILLVALIGWAA
jgi:hypothetical protein